MESGKKGVSRRTFFQTTAGVAAGAAAVGGALRAVAGDAPTTGPATAAAPSVAPYKPDDRPFKLGIVGCGWQGKILMREALKIPGTQFTAICDIVPTRRKEAQEIAGGKAKEFEDYAELIKNADMNALICAAPLHMHHPVVMEAFKAKRDVFCEKCIARTIDEAKEMVKTAMAGGRVLQIGHHLRYHAMYHIAKKKFIAKGELGKVNNIHCAWNRNGPWRKPAVEGEKVDFGKWKYENPDELWNWRLYKKFSGGLMTELASHQLDVMNWFLDDALPIAVQGVGRIDRKDGRTIFDNVHLLYEYPNDVQVTYESITTNSYNPYGWEAFEMIQGEKSTMIMVHLGPKYMGLYFLEPGVREALWMPLAMKVSFDTGNIAPDAYKKAIVLGKPTGDDKISGIVIESNLVDPDNKLTKSTYELEMIDFKACVLDRASPFCDGLIGLKSAVPALVGNEAMEKQQRIVIDPKLAQLA